MLYICTNFGVCSTFLSKVIEGGASLKILHPPYLRTSPKKPTQNRVKDIHREKPPSDETPAPAESMEMGIRVVDTSNQLFMGGS